jgi:hypothetical protein
VRTRELDVVKAIRLHNEGRSWHEIGVMLAAEIHRRSAFQARSVTRAVRNNDLGRVMSKPQP